jgi:hypothetical protein
VLANNGDSCNGPGDCQSGHCYDGGGLGKVCCDKDCNGVCESCAQTTAFGGTWKGSCLPVAAGEVGRCQATGQGNACNAKGSCSSLTQNGQGCSMDNQCAGGKCFGAFGCIPHDEPPMSPCLHTDWCKSNMCDSNNLCK